MRALALALGLLALLRTGPARAWACADPVAAVLESPRAAKAPLNLHLRVRFTSKPSAADLREITLRSANGKVVPLRGRELPEYATPPRIVGMHPSVLMELVPLQELEPNTEYELSWKVSETTLRRFPNPPYTGVLQSGDVLSIGKVHTGARRDRMPPVMPASLNSVLVDYGGVVRTYKSDAPDRISPASLRAWLHARVRIDAVSDDLTPKNELYYWAWRVGAEQSEFLLQQAHFSFRKPGVGLLSIGSAMPPSECSTGYEFPFPQKTRRFELAVIAVDLAGNVSEPRYLVLDRHRRRRKVPAEFLY